MNLQQALAALSSAEPEQRIAAAEHLAQMEALDPKVIVPLVRSTSDEVEEVREWAVSALEEAGAPDVRDCEQLEHLLLHDAPDTAYWAATLLGRLGSEAMAAAAALSNAIENHPLDAVRERAAWALGRIGATSGDVRSTLERAASSANPRLARLAKKALSP